jgi:hypothetical protein
MEIMDEKDKNTGIVEGKLVGMVQIIEQEMIRENRVIVTSKEETSRIDKALAEGMKKIRKESDILQKNSWNAMKGIIIS